jgi:hypothetical protein
MNATIRRFMLFLVLASLGLSAVVVTNSSGTVYAQATAYKAGNSIKVGSDLYEYKGIDTRSSSTISGWSVYLPKNFSCGDTLVLDNPATENRIATRTTTVSENEGSPVIDDCRTNSDSQILFTLVEITQEDLCTQQAGYWRNNACIFQLVNIALPLIEGKCYSKDGSRYTEISCPRSPAPGRNCLSASVSSPSATGFTIIDCTTGRQLNENGLPDCTSSADTECQQQDGQYRCWDGSVIPIAPNVQCPTNSEQIPKNRCINSGGEWNESKGKCTCEPPLKLKKKQAVCVAPEQEENIDGDFVETAITVDCEEKDSSGNATTLTSENCGIISYIVWGINILSAIAGLAIVGSIMVAGYQYMTARDNSGQVEAAKKRILWALIAFGMFLFMYALLNWLVPGGLGLT